MTVGCSIKLPCFANSTSLAVVAYHATLDTPKTLRMLLIAFYLGQRTKVTARLELEGFGCGRDGIPGGGCARALCNHYYEMGRRGVWWAELLRLHQLVLNLKHDSLETDENMTESTTLLVHLTSTCPFSPSATRLERRGHLNGQFIQQIIQSVYFAIITMLIRSTLRSYRVPIRISSQ